MSGESAAPPKPLIVIVEDAPDCSSALEIVLSGVADTGLRTFGNGAAAWSFLESADGGSVAAIITDLDLPVIDGMELIRRIRSCAAHASTPVIVISATTETTAPERVLAAGANAFFAKPWSPQKVRAKVEEFVYANKGSTK